MKFYQRFCLNKLNEISKLHSRTSSKWNVEEQTIMSDSKIESRYSKTDEKQLLAMR